MKSGLAAAALIVLTSGCTASPPVPSLPTPALKASAVMPLRARSTIVRHNALWPPGLAPETGWYVRSSGPLSRGTRTVPSASASTMPYIDGPAIYPTSTAKQLPADGAVIYVSLPAPKQHPRRPNSNFWRLDGRPRIADFEVEPRWEGQVAPNVPEYRLWYLADRQLVDARIWFGTQHPSASTLALAQRELKTLTIPPFHPAPRTTEGRCPSEPSPGTYRPLVESNSAPAGGTFDVWGGVPTRMEDGRYGGPGGRIEFWWNLDPDKYWTVMGSRTPAPGPDGPVGVLGARPTSHHCNYELRLRAPNVPPGDYAITPVSVGRGSSTSFLPLTFHVTGEGSSR